MLISYYELCELIEQGVVDAPMENVNKTSVNIRLDKDILVESADAELVDLSHPKPSQRAFWIKEAIPSNGFIMAPGEFLLGKSIEKFRLPSHIACEFRLRSSMVRNFINTSLTSWSQPGWGSSSTTAARLTLGLQNVSNNHRVLLKYGVIIGRMVFWKTDPVPKIESFNSGRRRKNTPLIKPSQQVIKNAVEPSQLGRRRLRL